MPDFYGKTISSAKVDENGDPVANTLDDLVAHIKADIIAKYDHWKRDVTAVEGL